MGANDVGLTVVKSEDDSGLETLWLLKKIAFLSEKKKHAEEKVRWSFKSCDSWSLSSTVICMQLSILAVGGSKAQLASSLS